MIGTVWVCLYPDCGWSLSGPHPLEEGFIPRADIEQAIREHLDDDHPDWSMEWLAKLLVGDHTALSSRDRSTPHSPKDVSSRRPEVDGEPAPVSE